MKKSLSRVFSKTSGRPPKPPPKPEKYKTLERNWKTESSFAQGQPPPPPPPPPPVSKGAAEPGQMFDYDDENGYYPGEDSAMDPFLGDYTLERKSNPRRSNRSVVSEGEIPRRPPRISKREHELPEYAYDSSNMPAVPPRWSKREKEYDEPQRPTRRDDERDYPFANPTAAFYGFAGEGPNTSPPVPAPSSHVSTAYSWETGRSSKARGAVPQPQEEDEAYSWEKKDPVPSPRARESPAQTRSSNRFSWRRKSKERENESSTAGKKDNKKAFRESNKRMSQGISRRINMLRDSSARNPPAGQANSSRNAPSAKSFFNAGAEERQSSSRGPRYGAAPSMGGGCYLFYDPQTGGSLYYRWSENGDVESNPIAFFRPSKTVPKFKYKQNGGRVDMLKVNGDKHKLYEGVAQFFKEAAANKGTFTPLPHKNQICDIYGLASSMRVIPLDLNGVYDPKDFDAVAVMPAGNNAFEGVGKTSRGYFLSTGNKYGHSLALSM